MGILTTQAQGYDDPGLPQVVVMPEIQFVDQSPTYSLDAAAEQDSANFFLRENDDFLNLEIFYTLKPDILPVEDVEIRIYQGNTVALAEPAIPGQLKAGGGGFETFGQLGVVWPDAREGGYFVEAGYFPIQLKVTYPGGAGAIETPINDADLNIPGWQCPDDGLVVNDLVWKHRPRLFADSQEVGFPTLTDEFIDASGEVVYDYYGTAYSPIPTGSESSGKFFDLFEDFGRSAVNLQTGPPAQVEQFETDPFSETVFFSSSREGTTTDTSPTADVLFLQYWMFESYSSAPFNSTKAWWGIPDLIVNEWPVPHHEGDVEYVQLAVRLVDPQDTEDRSLWMLPLAVTASQHHYGQTLPWDPSDGDPPITAFSQTRVEHTGNERFNAYVALGAHATYLAADPYIKTAQGITEDRLGNERVYEPIVDVVSEVYDRTCLPAAGTYECSPGGTQEIEYELKALISSGLFWDYLGRWGFVTPLGDTGGTSGPPGPTIRTGSASDGSPVSLLDEPCLLHNGAIRTGESYSIELVCPGG